MPKKELRLNPRSQTRLTSGGAFECDGSCRDYWDSADVDSDLTGEPAYKCDAEEDAVAATILAKCLPKELVDREWRARGCSLPVGGAAEWLRMVAERCLEHNDMMHFSLRARAAPLLMMSREDTAEGGGAGGVAAAEREVPIDLITASLSVASHGSSGCDPKMVAGLWADLGFASHIVGLYHSAAAAYHESEAIAASSTSPQVRCLGAAACLGRGKAEEEGSLVPLVDVAKTLSRSRRYTRLPAGFKRRRSLKNVYSAETLRALILRRVEDGNRCPGEKVKGGLGWFKSLKVLTCTLNPKPEARNPNHLRY